MAFFYFLFFSTLMTGFHCLQWSPNPDDNAVIYVCAQGTLSLPWTLTLGQGDVIDSVKWFFSGSSQELVGMESSGSFFATPAFSGRVQRTTNVGLDLQHAQVKDSGTYSVEVTARSAAGGLVTMSRHAVVHITDVLPTVDGHLHARQGSVAEYDSTTNQFHVALWCGTFTTPNKPFPDVVWLTPSGQQVPSSGYENGHYLLKMANPVVGGTYTCRPPPSFPCLPGQGAVVTVDGLEARLAVLEAQNNRLATKNTQLEQEVAGLKTQMSGLHTTAGVSPQRIAFHAVLTQSVGGSSNILSPWHTVTNQGHNFDTQTGRFTAPVSGMYFFTASTSTGTEAPSTRTFVDLMLMKEGEKLSHAFSQEQDGLATSGTVHAVVPLAAGQSVWLTSPRSDSYVHDDMTSFSGFLLYSD